MSQARGTCLQNPDPCELIQNQSDFAAMSRRSRRSSTAVSSMATSVAMRQDRDAGAVMRLMTGKTPVPAVRSEGASRATQRVASEVPFTCYRCGQALTGSLDDNTHPCLRNLEHTAKEPVTKAQYHLIGSLGDTCKLTSSTLTKAKIDLVNQAAAEDFIAATPSGSPRATRDAPRDPAAVEQARSDLLKRGLPCSNDDMGPSKRQRLRTKEQRPIEVVVPPKPVTVVSLSEKQKDSVCRERVAQTQEQQVEEGVEDGTNNVAVNAPGVSRRRSSRAATQAVAKAAASIAYQERYKAEIARAFHCRSRQPDGVSHNTSGCARTLPTKQNSQQKSTTDSNCTYEVEIVTECRRNQRGELEYLVVWKGYPQSDATWEPAENLADLEPELFVVDCEVAPDPFGGSISGTRKLTMRGSGNLRSACRRCRSCPCGARRLVTKGETKVQSLAQQDKPSSHSRSSETRPIIGGYTGSGSWPVELLGPKPAPPHWANLAAVGALETAPVMQSRKDPQISVAETSHSSSRAAGIDTNITGATANGGGDKTGDKNGSGGLRQPLALDEVPATVAQLFRSGGPCQHLEKGKLPSGWYSHLVDLA